MTSITNLDGYLINAFKSDEVDICDDRKIQAHYENPLRIQGLATFRAKAGMKSKGLSLLKGQNANRPRECLLMTIMLIAKGVTIRIY